MREWQVYVACFICAAEAATIWSPYSPNIVTRILWVPERCFRGALLDVSPRGGGGSGRSRRCVAVKGMREEGLGEAPDSGEICLDYDNPVALHGDVYDV